MSGQLLFLTVSGFPGTATASELANAMFDLQLGRFVHFCRLERNGHATVGIDSPFPHILEQVQEKRLVRTYQRLKCALIFQYSKLTTPELLIPVKQLTFGILISSHEFLDGFIIDFTAVLMFDSQSFWLYIKSENAPLIKIQYS